MANKVKETASFEAKYSKEQFIKSKNYAAPKYVLETVLEDGVLYTKAEAETLLNNYMKGKVK